MTDTTAPRTAAPDPERPDRPVLMSAELMDSLVTRDAWGNRLHVAWGEPDEAGFYSPTVSVDFTDNIATEAAREAIEPLLALVRAALARTVAMIDDPARYVEVNRMYRAGWVDALRAVRDDPVLGGGETESVRVAARKPE